MKKIILSVLLGLSMQVGAALTPPKPIEGAPFIITKSFSTTAGDATFTIQIPEGWGIGEMSAKPDGSGNFKLFPVNGGVGCRIDVKRFATAALADKALKDRKGSFKASPLKEGFEAELQKGWFSCRVNGAQLIETWYILPKKSKEAKAAWNILKACLSCTSKSDFATADQPFRPITKASDGYICHHPNNHLHVLLKNFPVSNIKPNEKGEGSYLLAFEDFQSHGFFYVKWDQPKPDTKDPFQAYFNEIFADVASRTAEQKQLEEPIFELNEGWAVWRGSPCTLIVASGEGFYFGFAIQVKSFLSLKLNEVFDKVRWGKD